MMDQKTHYAWPLILLTPFFFYITHALAFFMHEYSHSFSAWMLGFKNNPFLLHFGDTSWGNILFFIKIDENVAFNSFSSVHPWAAAFIASAGILGNVVLFLIAINALFSKKYHYPFYYYFFIWLAIMDLGNFNDYIPARTFATHGDIGEVTTFLSLSPWWIMVLAGYPICYAFWFFYSKMLPHAYKKLGFNSIQQIILLVMATLTLFALLSLYAVPIVMVGCWPLRKKVTMI